MAQKYYNSAEAAKILGVSPAEINDMVLRRELYGYRDGADWKFKPEDIERVAAERAESGHEVEGDNVLASEIELGQSDPGMSGTVIGADKNASPAESDIHLADSDVKLSDGAASPPRAISICWKAASTWPGPKHVGRRQEGRRRREGLAVRRPRHDVGPRPHAGRQQRLGSPQPSPPPPAIRPSIISGKKLEDDDLVLGGSGTGSDISIGGDSGISLVDPADSGLSLEAPLNLSGGEESLELGEDDLLGMASDIGGFRSEGRGRLPTHAHGRPQRRRGLRKRLASHRLGYRGRRRRGGHHGRQRRHARGRHARRRSRG